MKKAKSSAKTPVGHPAGSSSVQAGEAPTLNTEQTKEDQIHMHGLTVPAQEGVGTGG